MASSAFLLEREERQRDLVARLVEELALLDTSSENGETCLQFCIENLGSPARTRLWKSKQDTRSVLDKVIDKVQTHSQHAKARQMEKVVSWLFDNIEAEMFTSTMTMLQLLSFAPVHERLEPDAEYLAQLKQEKRRIEGGHVVDAEALMGEIDHKLTPSKLPKGKDDLEGGDDDESDLIDKDWLDDSFSSVSGGFSDDDEHGDEVSSDESNETNESMDKYQVEQHSAKQRKHVSSSQSAIAPPPKETNYFNLKCHNALVSVLSQKEQMKVPRELLPTLEDGIVHEIEVVRCVLMCLNGNENAPLFDYDPSSRGFSVRNNRFSLAHSTRSSLNEVLSKFAVVASQLQTIRCFCHDNENDSSLTIQSFKATLLDTIVRDRFETTFSELEANVRGKRLLTLLGVMRSLDNDFKQIHELYNLVRRLETSGSTTRAFLDIIHRTVENRLLLSSEKDNQQLLNLFFMTIRPIVLLIHRMLVTGTLEDPFKEFFIQEESEGEATEPSSSCTGLVLKTDQVPICFASYAEQLFTCMKSIRLIKADDDATDEILCETRLMENHLESIRKVTDDIFANVVQDCIVNPILFECHRIEKAVLGNVLDKHNILGELDTVGSVFLIRDENMLYRFLADLFHGVDRDTMVEHPVVAEAMQLYLDEQHDNRIPLGTLNPTPPKDHQQTVDSSIQADVLSRILKSDLEGDDPSSKRYENFVGAKFEGASFASGSSGSDLSGVHALDGLYINYQVVSPMEVVLDEKCMALYQAIFRFLLQIKRTRFALCELQHSLRRQPDLKFHRLTVNLAEHLHFVNNVHAYIVHRVNQFAPPAPHEANSLQDLYTIHYSRLKTIAGQCLISSDNPEQPSQVMQAVLELLDCSLKFRSFSIAYLRNEEQRNRLNAQLELAHKRFQRTNRFLLIILTQRAAIGGTMHLDDVLVRLDFNQSYKTQL